MQLTRNDLLILLTLLEHEKNSAGLTPVEEILTKKLEEMYKELGGQVYEQ